MLSHADLQHIQLQTVHASGKHLAASSDPNGGSAMLVMA